MHFKHILLSREKLVLMFFFIFDMLVAALKAESSLFEGADSASFLQKRDLCLLTYMIFMVTECIVRGKNSFA